MSDVNTFVEAITAANPGLFEYTRKQLLDFAKENGYRDSVVWHTIKSSTPIKRGIYNISRGPNPQTVVPFRQPEVISVTEEGTYIPTASKTYVKWGHYNDVKRIIESTMFFPVYLTGPSGNGKTMMVEQACAELKRQYIRVQISPETDEDDLIGGFRLVNGETVFAKGPVIKAMEAGAVLLIDEIDRGSNKLMALQGVLEGKPLLIKKTGELITPAAGFNVIATSNTKGKGSEDGRYIAATVIDEAFLERFVITIEQPYPSIATEKKIVVKHMEYFGRVDQDFADNLTKWSQTIRKTFDEGGVDEIISTRRLCHIAQTFAIFSDRHKSVSMCISRFDGDTRTAFIDLYSKIDSTPSKSVEYEDFDA